MIVAVSYEKDTGEIGAHFGHATCFALYDYYGTDITECKKTLVDCSDRHGHEAMVKLMKENHVEAVLCGNMGQEAWDLLIVNRIAPVIGYTGDADTAADLLVTGQLPRNGYEGGGCGGGCGGSCGGGCCGSSESDSESNGACGCGCH